MGPVVAAWLLYPAGPQDVEIQHRFRLGPLPQIQALLARVDGVAVDAQVVFGTLDPTLLLRPPHWELALRLPDVDLLFLDLPFPVENKTSHTARLAEVEVQSLGEAGVVGEVRDGVGRRQQEEIVRR